MIDTVTDAGPFDLAFDQSYSLQFGEVLRHGRLRQRQLIDDVAADTDILFRQEIQDRYPGRMGQRLRQVYRLAMRFVMSKNLAK